MEFLYFRINSENSGFIIPQRGRAHTNIRQRYGVAWEFKESMVSLSS